MRTRDKSYSDYGLSKHEVKYLLKLCKDLSLRSSLNESAKEVYPEIALELANSLAFGWSWESMNAKNYIPIDENSFYGYRRKTLWIFAQKIKKLDVLLI